jgi:hypothetical protein
MKLHFSKNENGDILVQIERGTTLIDFNYIEMLNQLISKNEIEESEWGNLEEEERIKLKELLLQISNAVKEGLEKPLE